MGVVYKAHDRLLDEVVALKVLRRDITGSDEMARRFLGEIRLARAVSHRNVCRIHDYGEEGGLRYVSMAYVEGVDLGRLLGQRGRFTGGEAAAVCAQVAEALSAIHQEGIVHRDLKPGNVMIDGRGRAKITDFGLAVGVEDEKGGAEVSGTPAYMAPEQLAGKGASIQSDIYALGLVFYELFTGRRAFEATTLAEWRRRHAEEHPTSPSTVTPGFDPAVERVILRCLEKDPKARPRSVAAVAAALPGGDPLAAALAAGETPSPEMVAAAGGDEGMKAASAWTCLVLILAGMGLAAWLSPRTFRFGIVPLEKPPEALVERSREIARKLGYAEKPAATAWGFKGNSDYRRWVEAHDQSRDRWKGIETGRPAAMLFWYRQGAAPLIGDRYRGDDVGEIFVTENDPAPLEAAMIGI
jgi:serine/threonine-protein kinase